MEILIPILHIDKELNWMGHELSNKLEELEELDKTCLAVVHGMYAIKRQQKSSTIVTLVQKNLSWVTYSSYLPSNNLLQSSQKEAEVFT